MASPTTYHNRFWFGYNVRMTDFETTKKMYEQTLPLQGPRKTHGLDQRPLSVRRRTWECWRKDAEGNYGMAFVQSYKQHKIDTKTNKSVVTGYHVTEHMFLAWQPNGSLWFYPKWMNSYTTWDMLAALLPEGIKFCKYGAKQYFRVTQPNGADDMYYLITGMAMSFIPYESEGKRYFRPYAGVVTEEKILIDRMLSKQYRIEFDAFLDYYQPMADLIPFDPKDNNNWMRRSEGQNFLEGDWLVRRDGEEYGAKWIDAVEAFLKKDSDARWRWTEVIDENTGQATSKHMVTYEIPTASTLRNKYKGEAFYRMVRPYKREPVPLGTPFMPNGRH